MFYCFQAVFNDNTTDGLVNAKKKKTPTRDIILMRDILSLYLISVPSFISLKYLGPTDGRTDRRTDGRTGRQQYVSRSLFFVYIWLIIKYI